MHLLEQNLVVSFIPHALQVVHGTGKRVHTNRHAHGLAYFYGGTCTFIFQNGPRIPIGPGECIYMPKGANYTVEYESYELSPSDGCYAINFHLSEPMDAEPFKLKVKNHQQILSLFKDAARSHKYKHAGYQEQCFSDLYKILYILKDLHASEYYSAKALTALRPAIDYIAENHTKENISVSVLAEKCGISESYLRKLFHKVYGLSPVEYARQMRLSYAKDLLDSGEYTVTAASEYAGFNDVSYFSREFKKVYKLSPNQYMKRSIHERNDL